MNERPIIQPNAECPQCRAQFEKADPPAFGDCCGEVCQQQLEKPTAETAVPQVVAVPQLAIEAESGQAEPTEEVPAADQSTAETAVPRSRRFGRK